MPSAVSAEERRTCCRGSHGLIARHVRGRGEGGGASTHAMLALGSWDSDRAGAGSPISRSVLERPCDEPGLGTSYRVGNTPQ